MKILVCGNYFPRAIELLKALLPEEDLLCCPTERVVEVGMTADAIVPMMHRLGARADRGHLCPAHSPVGSGTRRRRHPGRHQPRDHGLQRPRGRHRQRRFHGRARPFPDARRCTAHSRMLRHFPPGRMGNPPGPDAWRRHGPHRGTRQGRKGAGPKAHGPRDEGPAREAHSGHRGGKSPRGDRRRGHVTTLRDGFHSRFRYFNHCPHRTDARTLQRGSFPRDETIRLRDQRFAGSRDR